MTEKPASDASLLAQLRQAARQEMSHEDVRRQRVSYVFGNMPKDDTMTRQQVEDVLARLDGDHV